MQAALSQLPDTRILSASLEKVFAARGGDRSPVAILEREANPQAGTFASEIVTCRLIDGTERRLFCKYGPRHQDSPDGRPGLAYEALVHHYVLGPAQTTAAPGLLGVCADASSDSLWLIFDYIDGAVHASKALFQRSALDLAARWIGQFHALQEARASAGIPLRRYDRAYYLRWPRRTKELAGDLHDRYPWLAVACERFEQSIDKLLALPWTVIHGDYYTDNILYLHRAVFPIDWEWAALAPGEIDLATLTDRWPADIVNSCVRSYCSARWPAGAPADLQRTLEVARLYLCFRYMGISREFMVSERRRWRFDAVRSLSEKLGLFQTASREKALCQTVS